MGRPGFMSNVSIWLAPPFIHSRMHRFLAFVAASAAERGVRQPAPVGQERPPPGDGRALEERAAAEVRLRVLHFLASKQKSFIRRFHR